MNTINMDIKDITVANNRIIKSKEFLRAFYLENYSAFKQKLESVQMEGKIVELGCGATCIKEILPEAVTTDVFEHDYCDLVVDATAMPFEDQSIKAFFLMNVFHHIPDVNKFLAEASRCLKTGGIIYISDQHVGIISHFILKYAHNEYFDSKADNYSFTSINPLNSANGALTWMVFKRDNAKILSDKNLKMELYEPFAPLMYWLLGGLKNWTLINNQMTYNFVRQLDKFLIRLSPQFGSFTKVILKRTK